MYESCIYSACFPSSLQMYCLINLKVHRFFFLKKCFFLPRYAALCFCVYVHVHVNMSEDQDTFLTSSVRKVFVFLFQREEIISAEGLFRGLYSLVKRRLRVCIWWCKRSEKCKEANSSSWQIYRESVCECTSEWVRESVLNMEFE